MSSNFTDFLDSRDSTEKREIGNFIILFLVYERVNQPEFCSYQIQYIII
jgi:hypothetical protein